MGFKSFKLSKRHAAKTLTWRTLGSLDTFLITGFISCNLSTGIQIAGFEIITKSVIYYIHERLWFKTGVKNANTRHILKTFSWRTIGTTDTFILVWIFVGDPSVGLKIGIIELITKMFLFYAHEKIWYKINYGLNFRNRARS